ncbi:MAG: alpha/beta hydrolase-fold protein [Candidatus Aminicenantales bacterium]
MIRKNCGLIPLFMLAMAFAAIFSPAQESVSGAAVGQGQALEGLSFSSAVLGREVRFAVYLPPDYQASTRRYPVVYLLHGFTDDESAWIQFGEANLAADRAIAEREIPPLIIVMPDGGVTWYINDVAGKVRYEDMFIQELIPHIDKTYRTRPAKEFRGIAGLSMGGWGALMYAMCHPEVFAACAAFSAAVWADDDIVSIPQPMYDRLFSGIFGLKPEGKDRLNPHFRNHHPLDLAKTLPVETLKKVRFYIDCGDDDFLIEANAALHVVLKDRKVPHEFRVRDGDHSWVYWRTGIVEGLRFIGRSFHR